MNPPKSLRTVKSHSSLAVSVARDKSRACDACRTKKSRCDGPLMPDGICSRCLKQEKTCTYVANSVPRGPPKAYVTGLEDRMENIENLLKRLRPEIDLADALGPPIPRGAWRADTQPGESSEKSPPPSFHPVSPHGLPTVALDLATPSYAFVPPSLLSAVARKPVRDDDQKSDEGASSADESADSEGPHHEETLAGVLQVTVVSQDTRRPENRFHGASDVVRLAPRIRRLRQLHMASLDPAHSIRPHVSVNFDRRPYFWTEPSWELAREHRSEERLLGKALRMFPPPALCKELVELYFIHFHPFYPMLHRPSWNRHWDSNLYLNNIWFTALCIGMFAIASKYTKDIRVLPADEQKKAEPNWHTAGSMWAEMLAEIQHSHSSLLVPASLFEVQTYPLYALYQRSTPHFANSWITIATGVLKLYDVGVHSRRVYREKPTLDQELWKRAFYVLYYADKLASAGAGRPFTCRESDFDVELPLDVDDEYLTDDHPTHPFQQPADKPSHMTFFILIVKLSGVLSDILGVLYTDTTKSNRDLLTDRDTQVALKRVNEAMARWLEEVPDYLKWNNQDAVNDPILANQSFTLMTMYHGTHTMFYRPFFTFDEVLPFLGPQHEKLPFPARALTINHAKALAEVTKKQVARGCSNIWAMIAGAHTAASLFLATYWQLKKEKQKLIREGKQDSAEIETLTARIDEYLVEARIMIDSMEYFHPRWEVLGGYLEKLRSSLPKEEDEDRESSTATSSPKVADTPSPPSQQRHPWIPVRPVMTTFSAGQPPSISRRREPGGHGRQSSPGSRQAPRHRRKPSVPYRAPSLPSVQQRLEQGSNASSPTSTQHPSPDAPLRIHQDQRSPVNTEPIRHVPSQSPPLVTQPIHRLSLSNPRRPLHSRPSLPNISQVSQPMSPSAVSPPSAHPLAMQVDGHGESPDGNSQFPVEQSVAASQTFKQEQPLTVHQRPYVPLRHHRSINQLPQKQPPSPLPQNSAEMPQNSPHSATVQYQNSYTAAIEQQQRQYDPQRRPAVLEAPLPAAVAHYPRQPQSAVNQPSWQPHSSQQIPQQLPQAAPVAPSPNMIPQYGYSGSAPHHQRPSVTIDTQHSPSSTEPLAYPTPRDSQSPPIQTYPYPQGSRHQSTGYHENYVQQHSAPYSAEPRYIASPDAYASQPSPSPVTYSSGQPVPWPSPPTGRYPHDTVHTANGGNLTAATSPTSTAHGWDTSATSTPNHSNHAAWYNSSQIPTNPYPAPTQGLHYTYSTDNKQETPVTSPYTQYNPPSVPHEYTQWNSQPQNYTPAPRAQ